MVEADTVGALFAHLTNTELATVASHSWLYAFGLPPGISARRLRRHTTALAVGLFVLHREPDSIVAGALVRAARETEFTATLQSTLNRWLLP